MNKLLATTAIAMTISAGSAFAADLPSTKAPILPPPPPPRMWTGFYVGLNAGGVWSASNFVGLSTSDTMPLVAANFGLQALQLNGVYPGSLSSQFGGFVGGGQIGYNYQFNNRFVVGIEADIQGTTASNSVSRTLASSVYYGIALPSPFYSSTTISRSLDYLGTVRGRLGWLPTPNLLVYATGGLAYGEANLAYSGLGVTFTGAPLFGASSVGDTRVGWTAGGGVEWMFIPNWSAKVEYLYYDLGTQSTSFFGCTGGALAGAGFCSTSTATSRFDGHIARAGVNYHFNSYPAPVVAKY